MAERGAQPQRRVPGEGAEADDDAQVARAARARRTVHGRHVSRSWGVGLLAGGAQRTAADDPGAVSRRPSSRLHRRRLVGEARAVHGGEQPVARAVAGEHAAGAVAAVGRGRQAEDEDARGGIAEAGDRAAPVLLAGERRALLARHLLAPRDQPRAAPAGDDLLPRCAPGRRSRALEHAQHQPGDDRLEREHVRRAAGAQAARDELDRARR